jgi:hypothetical protein
VTEENQRRFYGRQVIEKIGAGDGIRTHDFNLGKLIVLSIIGCEWLLNTGFSGIL